MWPSSLHHSKPRSHEYNVMGLHVLLYQLIEAPSAYLNCCRQNRLFSRVIVLHCVWSPGLHRCDTELLCSGRPDWAIPDARTVKHSLM